MSWTQEYSVPSLLDLACKLHGASLEQIVREFCASHGTPIIGTAPVILHDDPFTGPVTGLVVTLANGQAYCPVLTRRVTADGNYGRDEYEWATLDDPAPAVQEIDESSPGDTTPPPGS
jgi:hypothetical protein